MTLNIPEFRLRRTMSVWVAAVASVAIAAAVVAVTPTSANAIATPVPLGTAATYGVLGVRRSPTPAPPSSTVSTSV